MTKVNGMYYLQKHKTKGVQRYFWICVMLCLLIFAAVLVVLLWKSYWQSPTRMTISAPLRTVDVPFPSATICHPQSVLEYKTDIFLEKIQYPPGSTKAAISSALQILGYFTEHQWEFPKKSEMLLVDAVLQLNNLTITDAIMMLGMTCEDFVLVCNWDGEIIPCFQNGTSLSWTTSMSHLGACCSFNYHPGSSEETEAFVSESYGINGGLSIIGTGWPQASDGKSGVLYSEGFMLLIHHPLDYAVEAAPLTLIKLGTETYVSIDATDLSCSEQVLELPLSRRQCIKPGDFHYKYRQPSCTLQCLRDAVYKYCKCHPYQLPRFNAENKAENIRDCTASDVNCFVEYYLSFKKEKCVCLPACSDVTYKVRSQRMDFDAHKYSINPIYKEINLTKNEFVIQIYMERQTVSANRRIVVMSWISLLANLGGIFNLCFGISILSLFEIIYYFAYKFCMKQNTATLTPSRTRSKRRALQRF